MVRLEINLGRNLEQEVLLFHRNTQRGDRSSLQCDKSLVADLQRRVTIARALFDFRQPGLAREPHQPGKAFLAHVGTHLRGEGVALSSRGPMRRKAMFLWCLSALFGAKAVFRGPARAVSQQPPP